jgi:anti-sigma factor (TIGR02949 family)
MPTASEGGLDGSQGPKTRMTCAELETFLYPYLDGEFDAHEQLEFERHLAGCPACAQKMHSEMGFLGVMRRTSQVAATAKAPDSLRENIQGGLHRERHRAVMTSWFKLSAAAAVALVAASGTYYYSYRPLSRVAFIDEAARQHAKGWPMEIQQPSPELFEAWFADKLSHRVAVPQLPNATVAGARLSNVHDKEAAYISYNAVSYAGSPPRRIGLFVFDDTKGEVAASPLPSLELDSSHGYNVALWRDRDIVYELVTDLDEADIRQMLSGASLSSSKPKDAQPPNSLIRPVSVQR